MRNLLVPAASIAAIVIFLVAFAFWSASLARDAGETFPTEVIYPSSGPTVPVTKEATAGQRSYKNTTYGFALVYPEELAVEEYPEAYGAMSVIFKDATTGKAFQVYVTPYSEAEITKERFALDQPSGVRENARDVVIDGVPGTRFDGNNAPMGDTVEVWVLNEGYLYEIATYKKLESWLDVILETWRFI